MAILLQISEKSLNERTKERTSVNKTSITSNAETKSPSNNNTKAPDDWSTSPSDTILFPETYLSSIKRVLENTTLQSNSSQPITKNGLGKQVLDESKHGKVNILSNEDEEEEELDASRLRLEKEKNGLKNKSGENSYRHRRF